MDLDESGALGRRLRDPVDHDAEQENHRTGHQALALQVGFRSAEKVCTRPNT